MEIIIIVLMKRKNIELSIHLKISYIEKLVEKLVEN
jgi:hypothetical protein